MLLIRWPFLCDRKLMFQLSAFARRARTKFSSSSAAVEVFRKSEIISWNINQKFAKNADGKDLTTLKFWAFLRGENNVSPDR